MRRKAFPSIRTRLVNRCGAPVQWVVPVSVNLSAGDQMLKYGSHATSGTEGGRKFPACTGAVITATARNDHNTGFIPLKYLMFMKNRKCLNQLRRQSDTP